MIEISDRAKALVQLEKEFELLQEEQLNIGRQQHELILKQIAVSIKLNVITNLMEQIIALSAKRD